MTRIIQRSQRRARLEKKGYVGGWGFVIDAMLEALRLYPRRKIFESLEGRDPRNQKYFLLVEGLYVDLINTIRELDKRRTALVRTMQIFDHRKMLYIARGQYQIIAFS